MAIPDISQRRDNCGDPAWCDRAFNNIRRLRAATTKYPSLNQPLSHRFSILKAIYFMHKNADCQGARNRDSYSGSTTHRYLHLSCEGSVERNSTARTVRMHTVRAMAQRSNKHAIETKWGHRDRALKSSTTRVPMAHSSNVHCRIDAG